MKPLKTLPMTPDGGEIQIDAPDTKLADGSTIIQLPQWTDSALVCWGGLRLGGQATVHLVKELVEYCGQLGGLAACMPKWGANVIWTFQFGFKEWDGATLCRNCFEFPGQGAYGPKMKKMPVGGWFTYGVRPKIEQKNKKAAAVEALLSVPPPRIILTLKRSVPDLNGKRIVEI